MHSASQGETKTHTHKQRHREPFVVKSQLPRDNSELQHPLKTAYSAGAPCILKRFTTHFRAVAANIELCALRGCKSMYRENSIGIFFFLRSELVIPLHNQ